MYMRHSYLQLTKGNGLAYIILLAGRPLYHCTRTYMNVESRHVDILNGNIIMKNYICFIAHNIIYILNCWEVFFDVFTLTNALKSVAGVFTLQEMQAITVIFVVYKFLCRQFLSQMLTWNREWKFWSRITWFNWKNQVN